jgi:hypothetical protein
VIKEQGWGHFDGTNSLETSDVKGVSKKRLVLTSFASLFRDWRCRKEENVMAANFKIAIHRMSGSLELKLAGDFDGTSACELLNTLSERCDGVDSVLVNTSRLKEIYPFGQDTFHNNLYRLKKKAIRLVFTGKKAMSLAPERNQFF